MLQKTDVSYLSFLIGFLLFACGVLIYYQTQHIIV
jgi:hypothetical protein